MDINQQLKELYSEVLDKTTLTKYFQEEKLNEYSAPFLLSIDDNYLNSKIKILFVGKETNKWWGRLKNFIETDNSIDILQQRYRAEFFGGEVQNKNGSITKYNKEPKWNNQFFIEYKKIRKELLDDLPGSLVWSNLLKFDNAKKTSYSRNTKDDKKVVKISKQIFKRELEILKPDYIIFATSYTYDKIIKEFFKNEIIESNVIEPKSLWKFKIGDITCYRTWHPATIKYKAVKNKLEYYIDIIDDIKSESYTKK
jgi:hypothetical protein